MIANGTVTAFTTVVDDVLFAGDEVFANSDEKRLMKLLSIDEDRLLAAIRLSFAELLSSRFVLVKRKSSIVLFSRNSFEFASFASFEDSSEDETGEAVVVVVVLVVLVVLVDPDGSRLLLVSSFIMLVGRSLIVNPGDEFGLEVLDLNLELLLLALLDLLLGSTLRPFVGLFMNSRIDVKLPEFRSLFGMVVLLTNESLLKLARFEGRLTAGVTVLVVVEVLGVETIGGLEFALLVRSLLLSSSLEKPSSDRSSFELAPESDSGSLIRLFRLNSSRVFAGGGAVLVLWTGSRSLMRLVLGDSLL